MLRGRALWFSIIVDEYGSKEDTEESICRECWVSDLSSTRSRTHRDGPEQIRIVPPNATIRELNIPKEKLEPLEKIVYFPRLPIKSKY